MPIKHKKINIGWVNNKNQKISNFFEIKNHCIDAKKLQEISKNKKFYADLDIKENYEFCPVFEQPSISPNKKFNRYESFGKNKLFDIERNLLAPHLDFLNTVFMLMDGVKKNLNIYSILQ